MLKLFISNSQIDLFDDESINLTRQVQALGKAGAVSDFTQNFNVPATASNNAVFSH